jgi:hypothetical protein
LVLLVAAYAGGVALILWKACHQPLGTVGDTNTLRINYGVRLWPLAAILTLSLCFAAVAPRTASTFARLRTLSEGTAIVLMISAGTALALMMVWVLRAFPNSGDEYAYLLQAKIFLSGRLWSDAPSNPDFFELSHVFAKDGKWVSEYPLGWLGLLSIAQLARLPYWLVSPLFGAALLALLALFCARRDGKTGAVVALLLAAPTPFLRSMRDRTLRMRPRHCSVCYSVIMHRPSWISLGRGGRRSPAWHWAFLALSGHSTCCSLRCLSASNGWCGPVGAIGCWHLCSCCVACRFSEFTFGRTVR